MPWIDLGDALNTEERDRAPRSVEDVKGLTSLLEGVWAHSWRDRGFTAPPACATKASWAFFPSYHDPETGEYNDPLDPKTNLKVEKDRPGRLATARAVCVGTPEAVLPSGRVRPATEACPNWDKCFAWRLFTSGADKHSVAAGLPHRAYKHLLAETRRRSEQRQFLVPTVLAAC